MTQIKQQSDSETTRALRQMEPHLQALERSSQAGTDTGRAQSLSNLPYVSVAPIPHAAEYPLIFSQHVAIKPTAGSSVSQLLHDISNLSGVAITADADVLTSGADAAPGGSAAPSAGRDATLGIPALPPLPGSDASGGAGAPVGIPAYVGSAIPNAGDLKDLLDQVALSLDAKWTYNHMSNQVHFYRYETRVFALATSPTDASNTASMGGDQQSIQGATGQTLRVSGADATTKFTGDLAVWKTVGEAIKTMLSPTGSITLSQATGSIVVRDRYDRVEQVAQYIDQTNAKLQLAILVDVAVYKLHVSNEDNRGINWNIMYNTLGRLASDVGGAITTTRPTISSGTSLVLNAPAQNSSGQSNLWAGSQFFLDALSTLGKTTEVTHTSVYTTNNQPAPVKVVQDQGYLAQTTSLYTNGTTSGSSSVVGAGATLTPGNVETGFVMQVLPSVQSDGHRLLLQMTISDSTLDSMDTVSSGGNSIQIPHVTARETMQRAWLESGQTLVLAGFEDTQAGTTTQTPFGEHTWLFGGNRDVTSARDAIVIVITPHVTNADGTNGAVAAM
ncbi:MAG: hypothetical protein ACREPQ_00305 [Rhodanobacter sp.]